MKFLTDSGTLLVTVGSTLPIEVKEEPKNVVVAKVDVTVDRASALPQCIEKTQIPA